MKKEAPKPNVTNLPAFLEMTPAQIARSQQIQEETRQALFGRVQANQEEAHLIRGIHLEEAARATLEVLHQEKRRKGRAEAVSLQLARLADAYASQGRFEEAAAVHPVKSRANEYTAIKAAIDRPDSGICKCAPLEVKDPASDKILSIPTLNKVMDVYSTKHKRLVPLIRCEECGYLNARPLPEVLARREQVMATGSEKRLRDSELLAVAAT